MRKGLLALTTLFILSSGSRAQNSLRPFSPATRNAPALSLRGTRTPSVTVTVAAETEASITMLSGIHTRVSHVDDRIVASLNVPVYVNGHLALPSGSLLDGRIIRVQPRGRLHRPAELAFRFERITLPDGQMEPISAILSAVEMQKVRLDSEGFLKGTRGMSRGIVAFGTAGLGALAASKAAVAGSAGLGLMLPATGAAFLTYAAVWPQGTDINLPPYTRCRIRLNYPVTVRVPW